MIVASFIEMLLSRAEASPPTISADELRRMLHVTLQAILAYVAATPLPRQPRGFARRLDASCELLLYAAARHHAAVFEPISSELAQQAATLTLTLTPNPNPNP